MSKQTTYVPLATDEEIIEETKRFINDLNGYLLAAANRNINIEIVMKTETSQLTPGVAKVSLKLTGAQKQLYKPSIIVAG